jgi:hypothetical protein
VGKRRRKTIMDKKTAWERESGEEDSGTEAYREEVLDI